MPGRRKKLSNVYDIHVPLQDAAHPLTAHSLLLALMKHLAFAREQCHAPYAQLEVHAQACQQQQQQLGQMRHRRLPTSARKAVKYFEQLATMLHLAEGIPYQLLQGLPIAVLLGSSAQRPREVYCLHLPAVMHQPDAVNPPAAACVSAAVRKLQRAVIMQHDTVCEWDHPPGPTKMWLLFQAPAGALQHAPPGFTIRRAFSINLRKAFQVNLLTDSQSLQAHGAPAQQQQQQQMAMAAAHQQCLQPAQKHQQQMVMAAAHQQCMQPAQPPTAAAPVPAAGHAHCGAAGHMEVDTLSQQLSMQMSIHDRGTPVPSQVWYQCSVHVKGLKPLQQH